MLVFLVCGYPNPYVGVSYMWVYLNPNVGISCMWIPESLYWFFLYVGTRIPMLVFIVCGYTRIPMLVFLVAGT